ncbi:hypothetical protein [Pseudodesulfovibrio indicus]|uniref:hypothetical protein n=1 Tax=Pseudodesulfovibrio indicus TaxID=1716143 RepID=UPI0029310B13|nr:hypothetical protein [Pseudodesulfovibrio indicus]
MKLLLALPPSSGRSIPVSGMDVFAEVLLHNRQLKITNTIFANAGKTLSFAPTMTYRSDLQNVVDGSNNFPEGWYASWDQNFVESVDGEGFDFTGPDGREDYFEGKDGGLTVPRGYNCTAVHSGSSITLVYPGGLEYSYVAK